LTAVGIGIALIGGILLAIVGFVWYPIKRILRKLKPASESKGDISDPGKI
jgi:hypothetical protein